MWYRKILFYCFLVPILIILDLRLLVWFDAEIARVVLGYDRINLILITFLSSLGVLMLVEFIMRLKAWFSKRREGTFQKRCSIYQDDIPISKSVDDIFNRKPLVAQIADLIMGGPCNDCALYVALYGEWGVGKTSICNLVKEYMNDSGHRSIFVWFSPWRYSKDCDLQSVFFKTLADKLGEDSKSSFVAKACREFSFQMECRNIHRKVASIHWLLDVLRAWFFDSIDSFEKLSEKFKKLLECSQRRIVVVIDDLERLPSEQVCDVVRFIKANGDLPGVVYLVLSDEEYLASAVAQMLPAIKETTIDNGREYLEKIFPFKFHVPKIDNHKFLVVIKDLIRKELDRRGLGEKVCELDADEEILSYVDTMRKAKSVVNRFIQDLGVAKNVCSDKVYVNKHIGDMVALGIIQLKLPHVFKKMPEIYSYCVGSRTSMPLIVENNGLVDEQKIREMIPGLADRDRKFVEHFMSSRLDVKKDNETKTYSIGRPQEPSKVLNYRLASSFSFMDYFDPNETKVTISEDDIKEFEAELRNGNCPKELIRQFNESGKLVSLLYVFEGRTLDENEQFERTYIHTLVLMSTMDLQNKPLPKEYEDSSGWGSCTIYERIYRCLIFYIYHMIEDRWHYKKEGKEKVDNLLGPVLQNVPNDVYILSKLIEHDREYHVTRDYLNSKVIFPHERLIYIENLFLEKISDFVTGGKLTNHPQFFDIFRCWWILLSKRNNPSLLEKFKKSCRGYLSDINFVVRMLKFFCKDNRLSSAFDDQLEVEVEVDKLEEYLGEDACDKICSILEKASKLDVYNFHAYVALRYAINQRRQKMPYSIEEQKQYSLSYKNTEEYRNELKARVDESLGITH